MSVLSMRQVLDNKRDEAAEKLYDAMDKRCIKNIKTSCGIVRIESVESSAGSETTLTFNESGDLFSSVSMEGTVRYLNGDYNAPIRHPTPNQVAHLIDSWDSIVNAIHEHDRLISAIASTDLRDIQKP